MSNYVLFDKEVSFSKAADRYFYILKAFEFAVDGASNAFKSYYDGAGNISERPHKILCNRPKVTV